MIFPAATTNSTPRSSPRTLPTCPLSMLREAPSLRLPALAGSGVVTQRPNGQARRPPPQEAGGRMTRRYPMSGRLIHPASLRLLRAMHHQRARALAVRKLNKRGDQQRTYIAIALDTVVQWFGTTAPPREGDEQAWSDVRAIEPNINQMIAGICNSDWAPAIALDSGGDGDNAIRPPYSNPQAL
ncbi:hypothetical protein EST38_g11625 [Candolleomyces aberdarensis]|uniref:Uncharacterized protein n=1 Tax=Candolleomyces aberdarensis TaxID=2316362 RepID=A0A4Q2D4F8_9AGAR|nr:hypothetical protein EST38_g11625 [Candolleomyces aberdarensis]